jgi:hypothetical protein
VEEPIKQYDTAAQELIKSLMPAISDGNADTILAHFPPARLPIDRTLLNAKIMHWRDLGGISSYEGPSMSEFTTGTGRIYAQQFIYQVFAHFKAGDVKVEWVLVVMEDGGLRVWDVAVGQTAERQD